MDAIHSNFPTKAQIGEKFGQPQYSDRDIEDSLAALLPTSPSMPQEEGEAFVESTTQCLLNMVTDRNKDIIVNGLLDRVFNFVMTGYPNYAKTICTHLKGNKEAEAYLAIDLQDPNSIDPYFFIAGRTASCRGRPIVTYYYGEIFLEYGKKEKATICFTISAEQGYEPAKDKLLSLFAGDPVEKARPSQTSEKKETWSRRFIQQTTPLMQQIAPDHFARKERSASANAGDAKSQFEIILEKSARKYVSDQDRDALWATFTNQNQHVENLRILETILIEVAPKIDKKERGFIELKLARFYRSHLEIFKKTPADVLKLYQDAAQHGAQQAPDELKRYQKELASPPV